MTLTGVEPHKVASTRNEGARPPVVIVGPYPPPFGGNSVHIQRLAKRLAADKHTVTVVDPYETTRGSSLCIKEPDFKVWRSPATGALGRLECFSTLVSTATGSTVHFHMSAGQQFYRAVPLLLAATLRARKRVLTIHSGEWPARLKGLSPLGRWWGVHSLRAFDDIICVNEQQLRFLQRHAPSVHLVPAYLPAGVPANVALPQSVEDLREAVDTVVVTSGYGIPTYGYETLLRAMETAQDHVDDRLGLVISTYATWDDDYWSVVQSAIDRIEVPTVVTKDLSPEQFNYMLSRGDIYVRATLTDGDAVAVREAAAAGMRIVASDAVARPAGAALFRTGDTQSLSSQLVSAVIDSDAGRLHLTESRDGYQEIVDIYNA